MPTSSTIPKSIQPAVVASSSTTQLDLDGQVSVADSTAAHSVATVRTKNTADEETANVSLLKLIELQEWRLCMLKVGTEPEEARIRSSFRIERELTQGYLLHLAVSKNPPVCPIFCNSEYVYVSVSL